ncbi:MAG: ribosome maturation factor RimP [Parvularculaceae bacterium]
MASLEKTIAALIEPGVAAAGFELVRVKITGRDVKTLQVMAERPDKTMSAGDCAALSHVLSPLLEESDPISGSYRLEVSSPGIDRPLTRIKDYDDWQGYEARIELDRMIEGRKRLKGVIAGSEDGVVLFDIDSEGETAVIPFDWIADAKLVLTDELIRESLKAAKSAASGEQEMKTETTHERG